MNEDTFTLSRDHVLDTLHDALRTRDDVVAAHLGGSFATERTDAWSDIDLCATVEDDAVESVFAFVVETLKTIAPLRASFRMPEPTWHGHAQGFYLLEGADPRHMVDLVVMKRSAEDRFMDVERHGRATVLFDREGLITPTHSDRADLRARITKHLATLEPRFILFNHLVPKALDRGYPAEAMHFYMALLWRPLVELSRIAHCPDRWDFGARYLDRDVPAPVRATIERLAFAGSPEALRAHHAEIVALFPEALAEARARLETYGESATESADEDEM